MVSNGQPCIGCASFVKRRLLIGMLGFWCAMELLCAWCTLWTLGSSYVADANNHRASGEVRRRPKSRIFLPVDQEKREEQGLSRICFIHPISPTPFQASVVRPTAACGRGRAWTVRHPSGEVPSPREGGGMEKDRRWCTSRGTCRDGGWWLADRVVALHNHPASLLPQELASCLRFVI